MDVLATMRRGVLPKLPYDAEVEYLESTSNGEYIDTGIVINYSNYSYSELSVKFKLLGSTTLDTKLFGSIQGVALCTRVGNWRGMLGASFTDTGVPTDAIPHNVSIVGGQDISLDGVSLTKTSLWRVNDGSGPVCLFRIKSYLSGTGILQTFVAHREYFASIKIDGELKFNAIPVRFTNERGETEGAFYDKVSGQLFRNAGAGSFVIGPDKQTFTQNLGVLMPQREIVPTARDYVQDGLIAMWDGIENAGWGVHDAAATVWKDLIGSNNLKASEVGDDYTKYVVGIDIINGFYKYDRDITLCARVEWVGNYWGDWCYYGLGTDSGLAKGLKITGMGTGGLSAEISEKYSNPAWKVSVKIPSGDIGSVHSVVIVFRFATKSFEVYSDGEYIASADVPNWNIDANAYQTFSYGFRYNNTRCGKRYNGMVYSRALTADEIAYNYKIDKARFKLP